MPTAFPNVSSSIQKFRVSRIVEECHVKGWKLKLLSGRFWMAA
jgi:hypothetical protein